MTAATRVARAFASGITLSALLLSGMTLFVGAAPAAAEEAAATTATSATTDDNTLVTTVTDNLYGNEAGTLFSPKTVTVGEPITLSGTGWFLTSGAGGSAGPIFINQPSGGTGPVSVSGRTIENQIPGSTYADARAHGVFQSDADGNWTITIPFPTPENSTLDSPWEAGQTQTIRILTGSIVSGDLPRNPVVSFTIVNPDTPRFTQQPQSVSAYTGEDASFSVSYAAAGSPEVRWERLDPAEGAEWSVVDGADSATLVLAGLTADLDGTRYRAVLTGQDGQTTVSDEAVLTVVADDRATFENLGQQATVVGTFVPTYTLQAGFGRWSPNPGDDPEIQVAYQWLRDDEPIVGATESTYTVTDADLGAAVSVRATLSKPGYRDAVSTSTAGLVTDGTGTPDPGTCVDGPASPDRGKRPMCDTQTATASDGKTYSPTVQVEGYLVPGGTLKITGSGWRPDQVGGVNVRLNDAATLPSRPSGLVEGSGMIPDADGNISGTLTLPPASDFVALQKLYGTAPGLNWLRFLGTDPSVSLHVVLELPPLPSAPTVTSSPAAVQVVAGGLASFHAEASGYPAPSVQWQREANGTWANISGATATSLHLTGVSAALDGTRYRAVFTNEHGTATSDPARLRVIAANLPTFSAGTPQITGTARVGSELTVQPGNWNPSPERVSYQWLRNGVILSGVSGATYTPVAADANTELSVIVTVERSGYTTATARTGTVRVEAAQQTVVENESGCITSPASPDRGKRPICNTASVVWDGVEYRASIQVSGTASPSGTVTITGSGWRPGQQVFFRYNDLNGYGAGAGSVNGDGTLFGSGAVVRADGTFAATVTLPNRAAVEWAAATYATDRTWIRVLGTAPALSVYRDISFADPELKRVLQQQAEQARAEQAAKAPTQTPVPPEATEGLTEENRGGVLVWLNASEGTLTATLPGAVSGAWVHAYLYIGDAPRSLGWVQVDDAGNAQWSITELEVEPGTYRVAIQDAEGALLGWDDVTVSDSEATELQTARQSAVMADAETAELSGDTSGMSADTILLIGAGAVLLAGAATAGVIAVRRRQQGKENADA